MVTQKPSTKKKTTAAATRRTAKKSEPGIDSATLGKWSFLIGTALAILLGLSSSALDNTVTEWISYLVMLLGLVGGVLFISRSEESHFILLSIGVALFGSSLNGVPQVGSYLAGMANALTFFLGFAVIGIAARNVVSWFTR